jgi:hypothetical protein
MAHIAANAKGRPHPRVTMLATSAQVSHRAARVSVTPPGGRGADKEAPPLFYSFSRREKVPDGRMRVLTPDFAEERQFNFTAEVSADGASARRLASGGAEDRRARLPSGP